MTRAMKWDYGLADNSGSVEYQYCLACDGALSKRFVYDGGTTTTQGALLEGQRYEYDGLNLLRVDELYGSTLSESGPWRTLEISTHQPGQLGALLHKRVYVHTNNDATPDETKDFTYSYDPVGNVYSIFDSSGNEAYYFTQDAFGNELPIATLGGDDWNAARADRIVEHQTGKWIDGFTELYYFHARWMDSEVGRFVGRDPVTISVKSDQVSLKRGHCCQSSSMDSIPSPSGIRSILSGQYNYCHSSPTNAYDADGRLPVWALPWIEMLNIIKCAKKTNDWMENYKKENGTYPHFSWRHCHGTCVFCQCMAGFGDPAVACGSVVVLETFSELLAGGMQWLGSFLYPHWSPDWGDIMNDVTGNAQGLVCAKKVINPFESKTSCEKYCKCAGYG